MLLYATLYLPGIHHCSVSPSYPLTAAVGRELMVRMAELVRRHPDRTSGAKKGAAAAASSSGAAAGGKQSGKKSGKKKK